MVSTIKTFDANGTTNWVREGKLTNSHGCMFVANGTWGSGTLTFEACVNPINQDPNTTEFTPTSDEIFTIGSSLTANGTQEVTDLVHWVRAKLGSSTSPDLKVWVIGG